MSAVWAVQKADDFRVLVSSLLEHKVVSGLHSRNEVRFPIHSNSILALVTKYC